MAYLLSREVERENKVIIEFFTRRRTKVLRVAEIERQCEIPKNTLLNLLTISREIPMKHLNNLVQFLKFFGYVPDNKEYFNHYDCKKESIFYYDMIKEGL